MTEKCVRLEVNEKVALVTLDRPPVNALSRDMRYQLVATFDEISARDDIMCAVLTGNGSVFCAGADLKERHGISTELWLQQHAVLEQMMLAMHECPLPLLAAVNGAASGLGADTALACDFIIASEWASFAWSYINRGIIPDGGGMYFLPRRVGLSKAKQLIFSGRKVDVDEALSLGIVDRKTTAESLVSDAQAWAIELSQASSTALALTKTILNQSFEMTSHDVFAQGSQAQGICYTSSEHRASVEAFLAKAAS